jgi:hypothetical protein
MIAPPGTRLIDARLIKLAQRIREEFDDVPGLRITVAEAARFFGLDDVTCEWVLARLLTAGFLATGADQRYRKA